MTTRSMLARAIARCSCLRVYSTSGSSGTLRSYLRRRGFRPRKNAGHSVHCAATFASSLSSDFVFYFGRGPSALGLATPQHAHRADAKLAVDENAGRLNALTDVRREPEALALVEELDRRGALLEEAGLPAAALRRSVP